MTSRDFCYWLQGYFEISGTSRLAFDEIETVIRHLDMVAIHESRSSSSKAGNFCSWLNGFLSYAKLSGGMEGDQCKEIRTRLNNIFVHEIDPSFPASQQQALNHAHNGGHGLLDGWNDDDSNLLFEPGAKC